jgi:hypothetical protein
MAQALGQGRNSSASEGAAMTRAPQLFAVSVLLFVGVFSAAVAETGVINMYEEAIG